MLSLNLHRRRAGKIAHLPPAVRHQLNLLLRDGFTYAEIIARLGDAGKGLNKDNLSRWRKADYQDWLLEQFWQEAFPTRTDIPLELKQFCLLSMKLGSCNPEAPSAQELLFFGSLAAKLAQTTPRNAATTDKLCSNA